jgi:osmoprotectant transport system ATP-binding protein
MVLPDAGQISVSGLDLAAADPVRLRRRIGYVPQDGGLLPHWSVLRNAALVPWLNRSPNSAGAARDALSLVGLPADRFAERRPSQLSGGQRQRVAIARALAGNPDIVLLDEPFGALDAISRAELQDVFQQLRRSLALTALLVTHDLNEAALLADRLAVLRGGTIEQIATAGELIAHPATPYVRELALRARLRVS